MTLLLVESTLGNFCRDWCTHKIVGGNDNDTGSAAVLLSTSDYAGRGTVASEDATVGTSERMRRSVLRSARLRRRKHV